MKKNPHSSSGETILEVIIAISVLMLILAPASALYISSTQNIAANRSNLIAASLAEEGIEITRNMRDTNLLRFSPKATECWNTKPEHSDLATCETQTIEAGVYRLTLDIVSFNWTLEVPITGDLLTDELNDPTRDDFYRLKLDPATHVYSHAVGSDTPFYREIVIAYGTGGEMAVQSRVLYRMGTNVRTIRRNISLTDEPQ